MKYTQKIKRIADAMEKLGVAALAIGIFQNRWLAFFLGIYFLIVSMNLTPED